MQQTVDVAVETKDQAVADLEIIPVSGSSYFCYSAVVIVALLAVAADATIAAFGLSSCSSSAEVSATARVAVVADVTTAAINPSSEKLLSPMAEAFHIS